jgi:hypothetical protein
MWAACHLRAEVLWLERMVFMIACRRSVDFGVCYVDAARVTLCGVVRCRYSRIDAASSSAARSRAFVMLVIGRPFWPRGNFAEALNTQETVHGARLTVDT